MNAHQFLDKASETINERGVQHDAPANDDCLINVPQERNMARIVRAFNTITNHELSTEDGWTFMEVLKMVRCYTASKYNPDSYIDRLGYAALAAEEAHNQMGS